MLERVRVQLSNRKVRDQSIALLIAGAMLLLPPVGAISLIDGTIAGVPFPLLYVFVVWILLIIAAAGLARSLSTDTDPVYSPDAGDPEA